MTKEIILTKIDNLFIGAIPYLGLISKGESAEQVYQELTKKHDEVEASQSASKFEAQLARPFFELGPDGN